MSSRVALPRKQPLSGPSCSSAAASCQLAPSAERKGKPRVSPSPSPSVLLPPFTHDHTHSPTPADPRTYPPTIGLSQSRVGGGGVWSCWELVRCFFGVDGRQKDHEGPNPSFDTSLTSEEDTRNPDRFEPFSSTGGVGPDGQCGGVHQTPKWGRLCSIPQNGHRVMLALAALSLPQRQGSQPCRESLLVQGP